MSDILIKGVEMPTSCNACMFDVYGLCLINKNIEGEDELTHSCPLIPVPPHGRLIDADALMRLFEREQNTIHILGQEFPWSFMSSSQELSTEWCCVEKMLKNAPTIIPASEEGE